MLLKLKSKGTGYKIPKGFKKIASSNNSKYAIISNENKKYYGVFEISFKNCLIYNL